jgi:2-oxo-4-hydroxy-4-carboxy-5-ureidoimidazoline decarboxylase
MSDRTTAELNRANSNTFVEVLGDVYEHSPWVAKRAWADRPFESIADLHESLKRVVDNADRERRLELLRAHPDLGEQTEMTDASVEEQASAGLDQLSSDQYEAFQRLNERYRNDFDFPFIMAVRDESPDAIRAAMEERVEHSQPEEFQTAMDEVHTIARLRLDERLDA